MIEKCKHCYGKAIYNEVYDAAYCPKCNVWLEGVCNDRKCWFCENRPETPPNNILKFQKKKG